ncbi:cytochrome oxidase, 20 [Suhomyces tanzawaensis NRRL Y-17324]|uniref:Cytochrome c oxidase assembly protein COX20, mitochondrial n=1 Tax=Suhomyces tanzawaensis NRRL Y-17324 TaxID=984487 RepID=A0A1E4SRF4_9ASCO|nr:cytochrome oxidase, 20 [Suhomyces tanzawaensis NRRL Y-17324]ODV82078.1 cytochrome oxidase, 20 [Suhomyces tanzawaensis NRRL Y-17324]
MGWFGGGSPSKVSTVSEVNQPQYLEDLPPKFEDKEPAKRAEPTLADAAKQISWADFNVERFVGMPCFREAMITGFQAMGVLGTVTFLIHKNPNRSINWAVCGFFLGNVVGWEQCRSLRRRQFQMMENARKANQEKNEKKWDEKEGESDEQLKKFKEFNSK